MFLKIITSKGVPRLYYFESYSENGKTKNRIIKSLGRLDELSKVYPDPVAHFKEEARKKTFESRKARSFLVPIDTEEKSRQRKTILKISVTASSSICIRNLICSGTDPKDALSSTVLTRSAAF